MHIKYPKNKQSMAHELYFMHDEAMESIFLADLRSTIS